jgi:hypothetical protein
MKEVSVRKNGLSAIMSPESPRWDEFCDRLEGPEGCNIRETHNGQVLWTCNSTYVFTRKILKRMGNIDVDASLAYFAAHGGYCDCEILTNIAAEASKITIANGMAAEPTQSFEGGAAERKPTQVDDADRVLAELRRYYEGGKHCGYNEEGEPDFRDYATDRSYEDVIYEHTAGDPVHAVLNQRYPGETYYLIDGSTIVWDRQYGDPATDYWVKGRAAGDYDDADELTEDERVGVAELETYERTLRSGAH